MAIFERINTDFFKSNDSVAERLAHITQEYCDEAGLNITLNIDPDSTGNADLQPTNQNPFDQKDSLIV